MPIKRIVDLTVAAIPTAWSVKPVLTIAQPRGDAAIVGGRAGPLLNQQPTATIPPNPAAHLGGPRLASLGGR